PLGVYSTDVFGEAATSPGGFITVDFLKGTVESGRNSASLTKAVGLYRVVLEKVCSKHGCSVSYFRGLTARYSSNRGRRVLVAIEDNEGRRSVDEYVGTPLRHRKTIDGVGRVRTLRKPRRD